MALYSYVLRYDDGTAPNPFGGVCTLTICKPAIRRTAQVGDWIIGTGSKQVKLADRSTVDFSGSLVYAMQITRVLSLQAYDEYCRTQLPIKLPDPQSPDLHQRMGDCVYAFDSGNPVARPSRHGADHLSRDLGGVHALLSERFWYFGTEARPVPPALLEAVHQGQGHRVFRDSGYETALEQWLAPFPVNRVFAEPQMAWRM